MLYNCHCTEKPICATENLVCFLYHRMLKCKYVSVADPGFPMEGTPTPKVGVVTFYYRPQRSWAKVIFSQACVCPRGGGVCLSACWDIPPGTRTPREQTDPGPEPPQTRPPPPGADTPPDQTPQSRHPPGPDPPPGKQTPAYGQRATGTHPTGMHSCLAIPGAPPDPSMNIHL